MFAEYCEKFPEMKELWDKHHDENVAKVRAINAGGTQNIADVCKNLDCKMIYISTDYVFDGQGETPWTPDCKDYAPLSVYGRTKLEGELAVANNLKNSSSSALPGFSA